MTKRNQNAGARMAGDERKEQILQTAMRLFSKNGFIGTTTKRIAEEAGISEAMVFRHFSNKGELYADILDHKAGSLGLKNPFQKISEELKNKDDFGVFYGIALNALNHHDADNDFIRLLLYSGLENHDLSRMFFESFVAGMYEFLSGYIRSRQEDGVFRDVEPKVVVRAFVGMMIHHSLSNILWDKERKILNISNEDAAKAFATILLKGVKREEAGKKVEREK